MRVLLLFDQIQMGYGGKERADTPLGLEKGGVGSYLMFKDYFAQHQLQVLGTLYCGPDYFKEHKEEVLRKIAALVKKHKPKSYFVDLALITTHMLIWLHKLQILCKKRQSAIPLWPALKKMQK